MTNTEKIIAALNEHPRLDDDALAVRTGVQPRQQVNQICRRLEQQGRIRREIGPAGKLINVLREPLPRSVATIASAPGESTFKRLGPNTAKIESELKSDEFSALLIETPKISKKSMPPSRRMWPNSEPPVLS
jgi:hypothetical protein